MKLDFGALIATLWMVLHRFPPSQQVLHAGWPSVFPK
jgi:hypothetical protein